MSKYNCEYMLLSYRKVPSVLPGQLSFVHLYTVWLILLSPKTLPSVPSVFIILIFDFPHFPRSQVWFQYLYYLSHGDIVLSQEAMEPEIFYFSEYFIDYKNGYYFSEIFSLSNSFFRTPLRKNKRNSGEKLAGLKIKS